MTCLFNTENSLTYNWVRGFLVSCLQGKKRERKKYMQEKSNDCSKKALHIFMLAVQYIYDFERLKEYKGEILYNRTLYFELGGKKIIKTKQQKLLEI